MPHFNTAQTRMMILVLSIAVLSVLAATLIDGHGHDYAYFLPKLLDTYSFLKDHGLRIHEYTASMCAGIFVFANPQSLAVSTPQFLTLAIDPVLAAQVTFVLFSILGGMGTWLCARRLGQDQNAALISAIVMTFSGFMLIRFAIGHLAFHSFYLAPLAAALVMVAVDAWFAKTRHLSLAAMVAAAGLIAIAIYSGIAVILLNMLAVIGVLVLFHAVLKKHILASLLCLSGVFMLAVLFAAPKIEASLALMSNLQRSHYGLPGFNLTGLAEFLFAGLFLIPDPDSLKAHLLNNRFRLGLHEYYVGLTPFVGLLLLAPLVLSGARGRYITAIKNNPAMVILALIAFLPPLALNYYSQGWNSLIKSLPVLGQSSNMLRWLAYFIPLIALLAGFSYKVLDIPARFALSCCVVLISGMALFNWYVTPKQGDPGQSYDPAQIRYAWSLLNDDKMTIPVTDKIGMQVVRNAAGALVPRQMNNIDHAFLDGYSNAMCYEPLFGYSLEKFPLGYVRPGPIQQVAGTPFLTVKNPSCYVYPEANNCTPGDHFTVDDQQRVSDFLTHKPVSFAAAPAKDTARYVAFIAFILSVLATIGMYWRHRSL